MTAISDDGLHLSDADGNLVATTIPGVNAAAWFPDSKRLLVSREIDAKTWDEAAKYLDPEQTQAAIYAAGKLRDAAMAYNWNAADPDDLDNFGKAMNAQYAGDEQFQHAMKF